MPAVMTTISPCACEPSCPGLLSAPKDSYNRGLSPLQRELGDANLSE